MRQPTPQMQPIQFRNRACQECAGVNASMQLDIFSATCSNGRTPTPTADVLFHRHICQMSHNKLYLYAFTVAQHSIYQYVLILNKQRGERWKEQNISQMDILANKDIHGQIVDAICKKDFGTCKKLYMDMVDHKVEW